MTVLKKYLRLEAAGVWRAGPDEKRRDVVVQLGEASLTFLDLRSGTALSHWSLPAVVRLNPGDLPARYAPGNGDEGETLELDDAPMIEAVETVRAAIGADAPKPGRLRLGIFAGIVGAAVLLAVFWLPDALAMHTASVLPAAARAVIGRDVLADIARVAGTPCARPAGLRAARRLADRLFAPGGAEIAVVREGIGGALPLPGQIIVLDARILGMADAPELPAAHLLAARLRAEAVDPLVPVLRWSGLGATLRLLATGTLPPSAVAGYGAHLLSLPPAPVDPQELARRAATAGVDLGPYAATDEAVRMAAMADPATPRLILSDADWISLQSICSA